MQGARGDAKGREDVTAWVRSWSLADVQRWLEAHELDHLKAAFQSASIDGQVWNSDARPSTVAMLAIIRPM